MNFATIRSLRKGFTFAAVVLALALCYTSIQYAIRIPRQIPAHPGVTSPRTYQALNDISMTPRARIRAGSHSGFINLWSSALHAMSILPSTSDLPEIPASFSGLAVTVDPGVLSTGVPGIISALRDTLNGWGNRFMTQGDVRSLLLSAFKASGVPESIHLTLWDTFLQSVAPYLEFEAPEPVGGNWAPLVIPRGTILLRKGDPVEPRHIALLRAIPGYVPPLPLSGWFLLLFYESVLFGSIGYLFVRLPGGKRITGSPYLPRVLAFYFLYPLLRYLASFSPVAPYTGSALVVVINQADEWAPSFLPLPYFFLHYASFLPAYTGMPLPSSADMFVALVTYVVFQFATANRLLYSAFTAGITSYLANAWTASGDTEKIAYASILTTLAFVAVPSVVNGLLDRMYPVLSFTDLSYYLKPSHPLLRKLAERAPGTLAHSYRVAELASHAAQACGANPVVARAGALYHDIGKILNPAYFTENQADPTQNPHEDLSPALSSSIIRAHIIEGERLARQFRLPPSLIRFIRTHHGDQHISFFYQKAAISGNSDGSDSAPSEAHFRYPGPRPSSAEEAIVMLADSMEATVRAKDPKSDEEVDAIVEQVLMDKLRSGQLSEARLTLQQLYTAVQAMKPVLIGDLFRRVDYPNTTVTTVTSSP